MIKNVKIISNILDPIEIIKNYGTDQLRYYLVKEVSLGNEGVYRWKTLEIALITILRIIMEIYVKEFFFH